MDIDVQTPISDFFNNYSLYGNYSKSGIEDGSEGPAAWMHVPAIPISVSTDTVFDTSGAGDGFCAALIHNILSYDNDDSKSEKIERCVYI
jgi:pyridoxal/pyridoxine/pyridoxamine kinase